MLATVICVFQKCNSSNTHTIFIAFPSSASKQKTLHPEHLFFSDYFVIYSPINTTIQVLCIWFGPDPDTCFGCPHQALSGRVLVGKEIKKRGEAYP